MLYWFSNSIAFNFFLFSATFSGVKSKYFQKIRPVISIKIAGTIAVWIRMPKTANGVCVGEPSTKPVNICERAIVTAMNV